MSDPVPTGSVQGSDGGRCKHRWTIIPPDVLRLASRADVSDPVWYIGCTTTPYCRDCTERMPGGRRAWDERQARYRRREAFWNDLTDVLLIMLGVIALVVILAYGGAK
jgi:hypothetical protein